MRNIQIGLWRWSLSLSLHLSAYLLWTFLLDSPPGIGIGVTEGAEGRQRKTSALFLLVSTSNFTETALDLCKELSRLWELGKSCCFTRRQNTSDPRQNWVDQKYIIAHLQALTGCAISLVTLFVYQDALVHVWGWKFSENILQEVQWWNLFACTYSIMGKD